MEEHTLAEIDSLIDWKIISNMAFDFGYHPADAPRPEVAPA